MLEYDGNAELNNLRVRNGMIIDSEINAGPLVLTKEAPESVVRTFNPGATAADLAAIIPGGILTVIGEFNGNAINRLRYVIDSSVPSGNYVIASITRTKVYARYTSNNTEVLLADRTTDSRTWISPIVIGSPPNIQIIYETKSSYNVTETLKLQYGLWFQYIRSGFTMKLLNLPDYQPAQPGIVYRIGNNLQVSS